MRVNNINSTNSFNGVYLLKGKPDMLDEICWYMSKIKKNPEKNFDFIDIRTSQSVINQKSEGNLVQGVDNKFRFVQRESVKNILENKGKMFDLFFTGKDKKVAEDVMRNMVEDTVGMNKNNLTMAERVKLLLNNLTEMDENVSKGKPVKNINLMVIKSYIGHLFDISKLKDMNAEDAYKGLEQGKFDLVEGTLKE